MALYVHMYVRKVSRLPFRSEVKSRPSALAVQRSQVPTPPDSHPIPNANLPFLTLFYKICDAAYLHPREAIYSSFTCRILYHGVLSSETRAYGDFHDFCPVGMSYTTSLLPTRIRIITRITPDNAFMRMTSSWRQSPKGPPRGWYYPPVRKGFPPIGLGYKDCLVIMLRDMYVSWRSL